MFLNTFMPVVIFILFFGPIIVLTLYITSAIKKKSNKDDDTDDNVSKFDINNPSIIKIKDAILEKGMENIEEIAKYSNCSNYRDCLLKIRYLKNNKYIVNYYIDKPNKLVRKCTEDDLTLLKEYQEDIYTNTLQIKEIAEKRLNGDKNLEVVKERVFNDIKYLYDKEIIDGIKIDEINKEIMYYTIEKKYKNTKWFVTVTCPNCGASVNVPNGSSERCKYCNYIISDPNIEKDDTRVNNIKKYKLNEWSYQRYGKFYGKRLFPDKFFEKKMDTILRCIKNKKMEKIEEIAEIADCSYDECLIKIRYLKNKRELGDYYIDYNNKTIHKCEGKDLEILDKYREDVYFKHFSIEEMATEKFKSKENDKSFDEIRNEIFDDIKYLFNKEILNGIKLDYEKKEIIYYSIEKKKTARFYNSINCSRCGALVEVPKGGSTTCDYCDNLVVDAKEEE